MEANPFGMIKDLLAIKIKEIKLRVNNGILGINLNLQVSALRAAS